MTDKRKAKVNAKYSRQDAYRARMKAEGFRSLTVYAQEIDRKKITDYAAKLRVKHKRQIEVLR